MLPNDQRILLQVGYIIERRERVKLEQQPADVGMKEAFGDAVRVIIVIDMLMVHAVFTGPKERRIFEGAGTEDQGKEPYAPMRLESQMREQSMVTDRDRETTRGEHHQEKRDLEPVNPKETEIGGHRGERKKQGANEKRAGRPVDFVERDSREHDVAGTFQSPGAGNAGRAAYPEPVHLGDRKISCLV